MKRCKICGKQYPYCQTHRDVKVFRWQDVACCPEHGTEYLEKILESRKKTSEAGDRAVTNAEPEEEEDLSYEADADDPDGDIDISL